MFGYLDKLARFWLDWRVHRALAKNPVSSDLAIKSFEASERGASFVLHSPAMATLFDEAARIMEENGAVNFLEFSGVSCLQMPPKHIRITLQFEDGQSPAALVARLKTEKAEMENKLKALQPTT